MTELPEDVKAVAAIIRAELDRNGMAGMEVVTTATGKILIIHSSPGGDTAGLYRALEMTEPPPMVLAPPRLTQEVIDQFTAMLPPGHHDEPARTRRPFPVQRNAVTRGTRK